VRVGHRQAPNTKKPVTFVTGFLPLGFGKAGASSRAGGMEASNRGQSSHRKHGTASRSQFLRTGFSPASAAR
jgi:hypothetical protein